MLPRVGVRVDLLQHRLTEAFSGLLRKSSGNVTDKEIEAVGKKYFAVLDDVIKLADEIELALNFVSEGNITGIVRVTNQLWKSTASLQLVLTSGSLAGANASIVTPVDTRLPAFTLAPIAPLHAREAVVNAYGLVAEAV